MRQGTNNLNRQTGESPGQLNRLRWLETLLDDVRFGLRLLRKSPGFSIVAILTLALGIGANTAIFSVVNGVLLNPLPYKQPNRLVAIYSRTKDFPKSSISYPNFQDWRRDNRVFSGMAAFREDAFEMTGRGQPERVNVEMVSASFFPVLGIRPILGRQFTAREDRLGGAPVVLIGEGFWKRKFGAARDIVRKTVTLNETVYTIVGVIPTSFGYQSGNFHRRCDVYVPIGQWSDPLFRNRGTGMGMDAVARLKPGVTLAQAKENMNAIAAHLAEQYPDTDKGSGIAVIPLKQDFTGNIQPFLLVLLAAVGFVLLIACVNVGNLLLARSTGRTQEFAVRVALGAEQGRVIRQLLTESVLLSLAGGVLGLVLAAWGTKAALGALPEALPRASGVGLDVHVLLFTLAASVLSGVLFGLAPALKTARTDLHETLKEGGRAASGRRHRTQRIFVAVEMALAVVLLAGAGLMIRSLVKLWGVNPGFDPNHVLTFELGSAQPLGGTPAQIRAAFRQVRQQLVGVPGVEAASLSMGAMPMAGDSELPFWKFGESKPASQSAMKTALFYTVQPDYLRVMKIPLIRGRWLTTQDNEHSAPVVVIDRQFARLYFGRQDPVGQRINLDFMNTAPEIVGVVGHVKQWGLASDSQSPVQAQMYLPVSQTPDQFLSLVARFMRAVVRTRGAPDAEITPIRNQLERFNGQLAMSNAETMNGILANSLAARRFAMILLGVFAGLALVLACVGIYGVVSYLMGQRAHEISVRMALGAQRRHILQMVLTEGAKMAFVGVGIGLAASLALTRLMSKMLFGVSAHDPLTFTAVPLILIGVGLLACYIPARRAMRVDPAVALRHE